METSSKTQNKEVKDFIPLHLPVSHGTKMTKKEKCKNKMSQSEHNLMVFNAISARANRFRWKSRYLK